MSNPLGHQFAGLITDDKCREWVRHGDIGCKRQCGYPRASHAPCGRKFQDKHGRAAVCIKHYGHAADCVGKEPEGCPHGSPYPAECPECRAAFIRGIDEAVKGQQESRAARLEAERSLRDASRQFAEVMEHKQVVIADLLLALKRAKEHLDCWRWKPNRGGLGFDCRDSQNQCPACLVAADVEAAIARASEVSVAAGRG